MSDRLFQLSHLFKLVLCQIVLVLCLTACGTSPQVMAQERIFPKLSLEFLGEYQLPKTTFKNTPVGGLSAITYDRDRGRFYALSDDRSNLAPARFYTLNLQLDQNNSGQVSIEKVEIEDVTFIKNEQGKTYPPGTIDPEGMALSPRKTLFISSEGIPSRNITPFIGEFELKTGQKQQSLRIPQRYLRDRAEKSKQEPRGVQENLGFEALTMKSSGSLKDDPFRLFTATESALLQDLPPERPATQEDVEAEPTRIRMVHYVINPIGFPILVAEHLYLLSLA
ncbi:MAG: esterase-like activity of phytase family protein, partial [Prochloraceae cyanobacterium]